MVLFINVWLPSVLFILQQKVLKTQPFLVDSFTLNTKGHMVKGHSNSERENLLLPHGLFFPISNKGSLYAPVRIADPRVFDTPVIEHWLEQEISMGPS